MAVAVAAATLFVVLERLAALTENKVREEGSFSLYADDEAKSLFLKLQTTHQVVSDVGDHQHGPEEMKESVGIWIKRVQDFAYELDDTLDEWETDYFRSQQQRLLEISSSSENLWNKVSSFPKYGYLFFKRNILLRRRISLDVKRLHERLEWIHRDFKFVSNISRVDSPFTSWRSLPRVTAGLLLYDESEVLGRDLDMEILMSKLLSDTESSSNGKDNNIRIVSIVGSAGLGKTTLAQLVYGKMKHHYFDERIWICVQVPFNHILIATDILCQLNHSTSPTRYENADYNNVLSLIHKSVSGKKLFLVLDDVWTENNYEAWKQLKISLQSCAPGSCILVTTRNERVAKVMGSTHIHHLGLLSDSDCWKLFSDQSGLARRGDLYEPEMLKEIGWEIAMKCKGMPLAAKIVGGLLRFKSEPKEWKFVLKSEWWEMEFFRDYLSYDELHHAVKCCFLYCAIFPKDSIINVDMLIRFWMAQGFLSSSSSEEAMEQKGREYFEKLAACSFFQDFETYMYNRIISCKMHDTVRGLSQFLMKNECLTDVGDAGVFTQGVRHLNLHENRSENISSLMLESKKLRSFLCTQLFNPIWFRSLKRVRLLSLHRCKLRCIPKEIENLLHIRYLCFSGNPINKLPKGMCELYYLQTLDIRDCEDLCGLPQGIRKLVNLRHLLIKGTSFRFEFPQEFEKLTNLRTLDVYCSSRKYNSNKLGYLKELNLLGGSLLILVDTSDEVDAKKADLQSKKFIKELELRFENTPLEVMEALQPHPNLRSLVFGNLPLPKWITSLANLRKLHINPSSHEVDFSSLNLLGELPSLQELSLSELTMKHLGHEFFGINGLSLTLPSFPKLKCLTFASCSMWDEWGDISTEDDENFTVPILPCLELLELSHCRNLKGLPHRLLSKASSLKKLTVSGCEHLQRRYNPYTGKDWDKVSCIQLVEFN